MEEQKKECKKCEIAKEIVGYSGICADCDDKEQQKAWNQLEKQKIQDKEEQELEDKREEELMEKRQEWIGDNIAYLQQEFLESDEWRDFCLDKAEYEIPE